MLRTVIFVGVCLEDSRQPRLAGNGRLPAQLLDRRLCVRDTLEVPQVELILDDATEAAQARDYQAAVLTVHALLARRDDLRRKQNH